MAYINGNEVLFSATVNENGADIEVVQEKGESESAVMSQAAVTAEFNYTNAEVDALKDEVFDIGMKVGTKNYEIMEQGAGMKGLHPLKVPGAVVNNLVFLDTIACAREYNNISIPKIVNNNKIQNAHFTPFDEETGEGDYYPTAHKVSVDSNGSNLTIKTVDEDDIQLGIAMRFDNITIDKGKPVYLACKVVSGTFSSGDGKLRMSIGSGDNSTTLEYPQDETDYVISKYVSTVNNSVNSVYIDTYDSEGNNITFNDLVLNVYVGSKGFGMYSYFPGSARIERDGEILKTTYGGAAFTALEEFAESIGANLDKEIIDDEYNVTAHNYIDMKERELVINVVKDETSGNFVACEERRVSVADILTANDFDGFMPSKARDLIFLGRSECHVSGSSYIYVKTVRWS